MLFSISKSMTDKLIECLHDSYLVARYFNSFYDLRYAIWKKGLVQQIPNLVKQETTSISAYIRILFGLYKKKGDDAGEICDLIILETMEILQRFIDFLTDQVKNQRDITMWSVVVIMIFSELLSIKSWWNSSDTTSSTYPDIEISNISEGNREYLKLKKYLPKYFKLGVK